MSKKVLLVLIIMAAAVIIWGFFMPWAKVKTSVTKVAKQLTDAAAGPLEKAPVAGRLIKNVEKVTDIIGDLGGIEVKTTVRGYDIPRMVNQKISKVALSLSQILFKVTEGLEVKSYLVYLLPLFAIVCTALAVMGLKATQPIIAMLVISGAVSIGGFYNLLTADLSNLIVNITIEKGLWCTMYAYLVIFIVSIIWLVLGISGHNT